MTPDFTTDQLAVFKLTFFMLNTAICSMQNIQIFFQMYNKFFFSKTTKISV